ncbi:16S rRNA (uracil1498-N3)-methyltransferase [Breznakia sp. PF5-3]|uniref:RsmE family RNA methyltransferase n=1 Tax=unclassified Breznakia TaxID=2623764 RepID=UPI002405DFC9|nr:MULTISPECIES: RsmE family RNA methyltransferase [unclassified Breznakia]MDF9825336.1 16S rRNA (uracil1498-N3)-methyltransferase [Breznakia sp. PM6-1]MDF9836191.1 16S rRNA (uracil1498-N3)-methyltransferase [Breznakia sp. PF5-3]MDF9838411.1 16S rRNA (uracil1498-N3)-methyltransferase [Breznakia sp. PFB2-8]MDF9860427.1 16S rRNA (uracil1498-N3)-methyltransferase [Breznakia sp. PH5-24]
MQQYFLDSEVKKGSSVFFSKEQQHHMKNVLRMHTGEIVKVVDNHSTPFLVAINVENEVTGRIIETLESNLEKVKITLLQGLIKGERWDFLLQKACELGVDRIIPFYSSRTIVKVNDKIDKKTERFNKIALEACEQSKRDHLVSVHQPIAYKEIGNYTSELNLIAYEAADLKSDKLKTYLLDNPDIKTITIVIGSEGGFSEDEVVFAKSKGFATVSLGSRILRAETAALASIQSIMFCYE